MEFQARHRLYPHHLAQRIANFLNYWKPKPRLKTASVGKWPGLKSLWEKIHTELGALIIQNNFDLPRLRPLGNLEASESFGRVNFLLRLNAEFANVCPQPFAFLD